jgi:hypothetical protein
MGSRSLLSCSTAILPAFDETVQFSSNDLQATGGLFLHWRSCLRQVFLQQLDVDVERTERIPNLVREARPQAREQETLLLRRQLVHILTERLCQNPFHSRGQGMSIVNWVGVTPRPA